MERTYIQKTNVLFIVCFLFIIVFGRSGCLSRSSSFAAATAATVCAAARHLARTRTITPLHVFSLSAALACSLHLPWHHASNHHTNTLSTFTSFHTPLPTFHARAPVARSRCTAPRLERVAPFLQRLQSQVSSSGSCQRPAQLRWYAAPIEEAGGAYGLPLLPIPYHTRIGPAHVSQKSRSGCVEQSNVSIRILFMFIRAQSRRHCILTDR